MGCSGLSGTARAGPSSVHTYACPNYQLLPPSPPSPQEEQELYTIQLLLIYVDGTKAKLSVHRGFRRFVLIECRQRGLRGYVWRVPREHAKILASGTSYQVDSLIYFARD